MGTHTGSPNPALQTPKPLFTAMSPAKEHPAQLHWERGNCTQVLKQPETHGHTLDTHKTPGQALSSWEKQGWDPVPAPKPQYSTMTKCPCGFLHRASPLCFHLPGHPLLHLLLNQRTILKPDPNTAKTLQGWSYRGPAASHPPELTALFGVCCIVPTSGATGWVLPWFL